MDDPVLVGQKIARARAQILEAQNLLEHAAEELKKYKGYTDVADQAAKAGYEAGEALRFAEGAG